MKLWPVAPFFHSLLVRFLIWKEKTQSCLFSFQITNLTKSEWKKRGNSSEFHSERNYYLQNWYFSEYWISQIANCDTFEEKNNKIFIMAFGSRKKHVYKLKNLIQLDRVNARLSKNVYILSKKVLTTKIQVSQNWIYPNFAESTSGRVRYVI